MENYTRAVALKTEQVSMDPDDEQRRCGYIIKYTKCLIYIKVLKNTVDHLLTNKFCFLFNHSNDLQVARFSVVQETSPLSGIFPAA